MEGKIYGAITAIMKEITPISKDELNKQQGFKFRGIDTIYNELHGLLAKHSVFTVPEVLEDTTEERETKSGGNLIYRKLRIKYTFYTDDGSSVCATVQGEGMDSGDKASNKAMAVGHKYALLQVFCIPTDEIKDPDYETPEPSKPKTFKQPPFDKLKFMVLVDGLKKEIPAKEYESFCKKFQEDNEYLISEVEERNGAEVYYRSLMEYVENFLKAWKEPAKKESTNGELPY